MLETRGPGWRPFAGCLERPGGERSGAELLDIPQSASEQGSYMRKIDC